MGNAQSDSSLSDNSDSEQDIYSSSEVTMPINDINMTVDATTGTKVSLPKIEACISINTVKEIQEKLDEYEVVSLVFLLFEQPHLALQELIGYLKGNGKQLLYEWAFHEEQQKKPWRYLLLEAICIIKNYYVLTKIGYKKDDLISHFKPLLPTSIYINKTRKILYLICEKMNSQNSSKFIQNIQEYFVERDLDINQFADCRYLEMYLLTWETNIYDFHNLNSIFKLMEEEEFNDLIHQIPQRKRAHDIGLNKPYSSNNSSLSNPPALDTPESASTSHNAVIINRIDNASSKNHQFEFNELLSPPDVDTSRYFIDPDHPGVVLIINQETFYTEINPQFKHLLPPRTKDKLESRTGTNKDREHLCNVFGKFGYKVIIEDNLSHVDMIEKIKNVANDIKEESSFFVCILSHGDEGVVYGANSCRVKVSKIEKIICNTNTTYLLHKPKLLILQSCQGSQCQKVNIDSADEEDDDVSLTTDGPNNVLSKSANLLTFWATIPGFAAIRNKKTGSWFIQTLCQKMEELANKHSFVTICTRIIADVSGKVWSQEEAENVMLPVFVCTFRKDFYLPNLKNI